MDVTDIYWASVSDEDGESEAVHAYRDATSAGRQALELWRDDEDAGERSEVLERYARCAELAGQLSEAIKGWRELAAKVDVAYASMPDRAVTLVLCDNYGQAGAINYYTKEGVSAVAFNADYLNWFDLTRKYRHVIRVKEWHNSGTELKETGPLFATGFAADSVSNRYSRE